MKLLLFLLLASTAGAQTNAVASWYRPRVPGLVAASYDYPIGSVVKVTELHNGCWVIVRIIERGPNRRLHRQIDLSKSAFSAIDGTELGIADVRIERVK